MTSVSIRRLEVLYKRKGLSRWWLIKWMKTYHYELESISKLQQNGVAWFEDKGREGVAPRRANDEWIGQLSAGPEALVYFHVTYLHSPKPLST